MIFDVFKLTEFTRQVLMQRYFNTGPGLIRVTEYFWVSVGSKDVSQVCPLTHYSARTLTSPRLCFTILFRKSVMIMSNIEIRSSKKACSDEKSREDLFDVY